jgi:hypothetical protein
MAGDMHEDHGPIAVRDMFEPPRGVERRVEIRTDTFERSHWEAPGQASVVLDQFSDAGGASCSFLRLAPSSAATTRFTLEGVYGVESCTLGGWLLKPVAATLPAYWLPRVPIFRTFDPQRRILSERPATFTALQPTPAESTIEIEARGDAHLECAIWRLPPTAKGLLSDLEQRLVVERQPLFMLASHSSFGGPADVYTCLLHGHVYEDRFDWHRKRKICCELEAYAIYVALHGLEAATGKKLYRLLKRQIVFSVISRQAQDGGWHHGEWTDFMESHYRFHNAAMLLLASALEESPNDDVRLALEKAAAYIATCADRTDIGLWFFHDSLEQSPELMDKSGATWIPGRELGKSPATKMILNSHLDAIVVLDRYREVSVDVQYAERVASALGAARTLLALRPAEWLYRPLYWAVRLTLLPVPEAKQLPLRLRVLKRLTRDYAIPQLYRAKRRFPRMVMPGGLIERHLSRLHFGVNYHSVNVADLSRVWRRFPREDPRGILDGAVNAVTQTSLLRYWVEAKQRQALGYWMEALYHLCTLTREHAYRRYLAEAMLSALEAGLGLPPSLLGAHPEAVKAGQRIPCPSPKDSRLRVANLSCDGRHEILVVNPANAVIDLGWETSPDRGLVWVAADERPVPSVDSPLSVPPRGWLLGRRP